MVRCAIVSVLLAVGFFLGFRAEALPMPASMIFVEKDKIVEVELTSDRYTVTLRAANDQSVLLKEAICRELASGYHCFIKPIRVPGILITDVNFARTTAGVYDITKIVLINGSITAVGEIGKNFVLEVQNPALNNIR